jgi:cell division protein FtsB
LNRRAADHLGEGEIAVSFAQNMKQNPWNWKDGLAAGAFLVTLGAYVWQGGMVVERLDAANAKIAALGAQMSSLQGEQHRLAQDTVAQRGVDRLHDEQIATLRRDLDGLQRGRK